MKVRFYFDYSDYRSYLMLHSLSVIEDLPVTVQWVAVDAYSLRALSGCNPHNNSTNEREYQRREALRFCEREYIDFIWQNDRIHSGSALRAGMWMMMHSPDGFEMYSRKILEAFWRLGKSVDASLVRTILLEQDVDVDEILRSMSESENFQCQDACLQEALADGVFDVPAVVIGKEMICHYDQAQEMRRLTLIGLLREMDVDVLCRSFAKQLMTLEKSEFKRIMAAFGDKSEIHEAPIQRHPGYVQIQHTLARPEAVWHIDHSPVRGNLLCHACPVSDDQNKLLSSFKNAVVGALNICMEVGLEFLDETSFADFSHANPGERVFYAVVRNKQKVALICLRVDDDGGLHVELDDKTQPPLQVLNGWKIAMIPCSSCNNLNMFRYVAHRGVHVIVRYSDTEDPYAEAGGCLASAWVVKIGQKNIAVIDSEARGTVLSTSDDILLDSNMCNKSGMVWQSPPPRTLLLCEQPMSLGELGSNADIELACRNMNLFVSAAQQSSELSNTRVFDKVRIGDTVILLMPVNGEQLFVTELLSHRMIETYNRAQKDGKPIMINYWAELEFEMLEIMRPVLAVTASMFHIPVVLVVGGRIVEMWLSGHQGAAYCIEKEADYYTVDLDGLLSLEDCFAKMLSSIRMSDEEFVMGLQAIETDIEG